MTWAVWLIVGFVYFIGMVIAYWFIDEEFSLGVNGGHATNAFFSFMWPILFVLLVFIYGVGVPMYLVGLVLKKIKHGIKKLVKR